MRPWDCPFCFLACDDRLLRRYSGPMTVQNPVTFITNLT